MRVSPSRLVLTALLALPSAALAQPNLALFKSGPSSAVAGTAITYTFTINNNGAGPATNVQLSDVLPAGLTLLGDSLDACGVTSTAANHQQTVACGLPNIAAGGSLVVRMNVLVEHDFLPDRGTGATNAATVTTTGETNPADNTDTSPSMVVTGSADLIVTSFAPANPVPAGETFTYSINVDNLGPSAAQHIIVADSLAASGVVTIQSCAFSVSRTDGSSIELFQCTTGTIIGGQFVIDIGASGATVLNPRGSPCDWDASAPPGDEEDCDLGFGTRDPGRLRLAFRLRALQELTVDSITTVSAETPDPDLSNNMTNEPVHVDAVADLEVRKVAGAPAKAGELASWTVTAINHGPSSAQNTLLRDVLPAGLVDGTVSITGNIVDDPLGTPVVHGPVSCSLGTPGLPDDPAQCDLGSLFPGWGAILTVTGMVHPNYIAAHDGVPPPIGLTNDVSVSSDTPDVVFDPEPGGDGCPNFPCPPAPDEPNFASASVPIADAADRGIQAFAVGSIAAGEAFHYEFQISNVGPSVSRDMTLRAFLPPQVTFLSAAVDLEGGTGFDLLPCDVFAGSNSLFCPLGNLPITGAVPVIAFVNVLVDPFVADGTPLDLSADVFLSDTPDPDSSNNSAFLSTPASNSAPDLFTEVFGSGEVDLAGWQLELTPAATPAGYTACVTGVTPPIGPGPSGSTGLVLGDDDFAEVVLTGGKKIKLYGIKYDRVFVGSNGYVTLLAGDVAALPGAAIHFDMKRVSAFFADLDPTAGGAIYYRQFGDLLEINWVAVPGYLDEDTSTFHLELYFDGRIQWRFAELDGLASVVGISDGGGLSDLFFESDFGPPGADYPLCPVIFADAFESGNTARWQ